MKKLVLPLLAAASFSTPFAIPPKALATDSAVTSSSPTAFFRDATQPLPATISVIEWRRMEKEHSLYFIGRKTQADPEIPEDLTKRRVKLQEKIGALAATRIATLESQTRDKTGDVEPFFWKLLKFRSEDSFN